MRFLTPTLLVALALSPFANAQDDTPPGGGLTPIEPVAAASSSAGATTSAVDAVARRLADPALREIDVALAVVDVGSGEWLAAERADEAMIPASNMKVLTTATALGVLGPDHAFTTRFLAAAPPDRNGVVRGDVTVLGSGDPTLRGDLLAHDGIDDPTSTFADLLVQAGVVRIEGRLVLDPGPFDDEFVHPEWDPDDLHRYYAAPIGGLSLHGNCLSAELDGTPAAPRGQWDVVTQGYTLRNELERGDKPTTYEVGMTRPNGDGIVRLYGRIGKRVGARSLRVPVVDPHEYFGRCVVQRLERRGIGVEGGLAIERGAAAELLADPASVELARFESPISLAIVRTNKESDNSVADHLFKAAGAAVDGTGSFASGQVAMQRFLGETLGLDVSALDARDGSGLARGNRTSARILAGCLRAMATAEGPARSVFLRSFPISGIDGSLRERLGEEPYGGAIRAKTGYIRGVYSLSGYAMTSRGRWLAFAMVFNWQGTGVVPSNTTMKRHLDDVCRILVDEF